MARVIFCAGIFAGVILIAFFGKLYVDNSVKDVAAKIEKTAVSYGAGDYIAAETHAEEAFVMWDTFSGKNIFLADKSAVPDISASLARIITLTVLQNDLVLSECAYVLMKMEHLLIDN